MCGYLACLLLAGAATRPATNPAAAALDREIATLIAQLDSPDAALREKATAKLINLGPRVFRQLKEAMAADATPEFMARAKSVLDEIASQWRYVDQSGGNVVGGFQAMLHGKPADFAAGRPISLSLFFRCVASSGGRMWEPRSIDVQLGDGAVATAPNSEGKLIIRAIGGARLPQQARPLICNSGEPHAIDFNVGGSVHTSLWIDKEIELGAGEYEVQFIYHAFSRGLLKDALEDLESNVLRIRVSEAK